MEHSDLSKFVEKTFTAIKIPSKIELTFKLEPNLNSITDPSFVRRILTNLATNGIQAMPNGGKLTVEAKKEPDKKVIEILVEDTGQGIPKEVQDRLFTPLFTTKTKGQGFGLTVAKRFVEALGGNIRFQTEEGKGTKFIIQLPSN